MGGSDPPEIGNDGEDLAVEKGGLVLLAMKFLYLGVFLARFGQGDSKSLFCAISRCSAGLRISNPDMRLRWIWNSPMAKLALVSLQMDFPSPFLGM